MAPLAEELCIVFRMQWVPVRIFTVGRRKVIYLIGLQIFGSYRVFLSQDELVTEYRYAMEKLPPNQLEIVLS